MKLLNKIKDIVWKYYFKRRRANLKREKDFINLQEARTVIILFKVTDDMSYYRVNSFVKTLQKNQVIVNALGYVEDDIVPSFCAKKLSFDFFTRRDLNWFNKPTRPFIEDLINKECDILIDLSMEDVPPLQYIAGLSKARQIIGRYTEKNKDIYDLMIDTSNLSSIDDFIKQIMHYASLIKN